MSLHGKPIKPRQPLPPNKVMYVLQYMTEVLPKFSSYLFVTRLVGDNGGRFLARPRMLVWYLATLLIADPGLGRFPGRIPNEVIRRRRLLRNTLQPARIHLVGRWIASDPLEV